MEETGIEPAEVWIESPHARQRLPLLIHGRQGEKVLTFLLKVRISPGCGLR